MSEYIICSRCEEKPAAICISCLTDCMEELKQQPIAGEFTANMRILIKQFGHLSRKNSLEACDRLDSAEASRNEEYAFRLKIEKQRDGLKVEIKELKHDLQYCNARFEEVQDNNRERDKIIERLEASRKELLAACENTPATNMFSLFADFAEECFTKPSMAVYRNQFTGLATFLRSCVDRAEKMEAAIAKAKKE